MQEHVAIIIQARMGSTRLPGKVLEDIAGRPMLAHIIERAQKAPARSVVVATTRLPQDTPIVDLAGECGARVFRGSECNLLDRYYKAALEIGADTIVRYTADNPFVDPEITALLVETLQARKSLDYICNFNPPTWPIGLNQEVMRMPALTKAWEQAKTNYELEHVNPFFLDNPDIFSTFNLANNKNLSSLRLTVDYPEDMEMARAVYDTLYQGEIIPLQKVLDYLAENKDIARINAHYFQKLIVNNRQKQEPENEDKDCHKQSPVLA